MNLPSILLWGFVATLVLTTLMEGAQGIGFTRMALPFILGTMFTPDRRLAGLIGFVAQCANGWIFSFLYALAFESLQRATWWLGAANEQRGPEPTRALEPPGFLGLNYGRRTPLVAFVAHVVYGAILGGGYRLTGA